MGRSAITLEEEININKFGQKIITKEIILASLLERNLEEKRAFLKQIIFLIQQSKPVDSDIEMAIDDAKLRKTYTPCVLLKKGVKTHNLYRIAALPENELEKACVLFLSLFRIAYQRRYQQEKNDGGKWWYADLSIEENVNEVRARYNY